MNITNRLVYIKEEYFKSYKLEEVLNFDSDKDYSKRVYLCLAVKYKSNNIFIPLRRKINPNAHFGKIGFGVPSRKRPKAGLDYRKLLIINNLKYIEIPNYPKIPVAQQKIIQKNIQTITAEVISYIKGYEKSFKKNRTKIDKKYRFSSLCNFHNELSLK